MKLINYCNRIIEYSFYLLFFLVPLYFTNNTSELYELNKMWLTWTITIVIGTAWISKMIAQKRLSLQRTPFDIPILLFLLSQFISTIFSLDRHVSIWGYYSRFNGGFLSILTYIFLYYAFVSNHKNIDDDRTGNGSRFSNPVRICLFLGGLLIFPVAILLSAPPPSSPDSAHPTFLLLCMIAAFFLFSLALSGGFLKRILFMSLTSGLVVALWGIPSHFGKDPTCLLFRGQLDVNCWTEAFYPTVRAFSTLGQPAWLAAYVSILIPIAIAYLLMKKGKNVKEVSQNAISSLRELINLPSLLFIAPLVLLYLSLIYANTKGGFIGFWIANGIFWAGVFLKKIFPLKKFLQYFLLINALFLIVNFFTGSPIEQLNSLTLQNITRVSESKIPVEDATPAAEAPAPAGQFGGTDSGQIRLYVWRGALDIWKANPLFGTGVETFAFAYYKHRPADHNLTSEWDYLYNKAHNEYLNYLATTGIFGLGSYLAMIGLFFFITLRFLVKSAKENEDGKSLLLGAFLAGYITILISNFFGFSVVIVNLYFFLIPAFSLILMGLLKSDKVMSFPKSEKTVDVISGGQWFGISIVTVFGLYLIFMLHIFRNADVSYALGNNLDNVQEYQQAYPKLQEAVSLRPGEPVFKDELALNNATLATLLLLQENASGSAEMQQQASQLAQAAITMDDEIIAKHPNNIVFWKNRVRIFYTLSQVDPKFLQMTADAMKQVSVLAPTDAKVMYNLGIIYRNNNLLQEARVALARAVELKKNYRDAYYALGLTLHDLAVDKNGNVINTELQKEARETLEYTLQNISQNDKEVREALTSWGAL